MGSTRAQVKELVKSTRDMSPSKLQQLIDGLWRDPLLLYSETGLSDDDNLKKIDPESEFYNPDYIYVRNRFRAPGYELKTSWGVAVGYGHSVYADFSQVFGYFNESQCYSETIFGRYATVAADCDACNWIETDRLLTVGNGTNSIERSDAFTILKSGYSKFYNAIKIEDYSNLMVLPDDGSLQYTQANRFEGYWDLAWHKFVTTDANSYISLTDTPATYGNIGCIPYMNTASTLGWSAYALPTALPTENSVIVVTPAGASSWQPYSGGGGGDAWLLGGNTLGQKNYMGSADNYDIGFITNNTERIIITAGGLVNPLFNMRLENTTHASEVGIIYKGAVPWIHDFNYGNNGTVTTKGYNVFIGENAGNFTMGATATNTSHSSYNVAISTNSLYSNTNGFNNVAIGTNSLYSNTTGNNNVAIGTNSLYSNTNRNYNVAVGIDALRYNTGGSYCVAIGYQALYRNTFNSYNTAIGAVSLSQNTTGNQNTAIGYSALSSNTTSSGNTAIGYLALKMNKTIGYNTAIGSEALLNNTSANNTAVGSSALRQNTTGEANVAIGLQSLYSNSTGNYSVSIGFRAAFSDIGIGRNTSIGHSASYFNLTGFYNVSVGNSALYSNTNGNNNVGVGVDSLKDITTGSDNVSIGYRAGLNCINSSTSLTIANSSIFLGSYTKAKIDNSTNEIVIGYNVTGNGSNTVTIGNSSITDNYLTGNLQIGNKLKILEGGATPTKYSIFQGGNQAIDLTYTLPTAYPGASGYVLSSTDAGVMSWVEMSAGGAGWELGGNTLGQKDYLGSIDNYAIAFKTNDIERMSIGTDGLINPLFNVRLENTTHAAEIGIIYKGTVPFVHNFNYGSNGSVTTAGGNTFVGENAGNLTMGATASSAGEASYNTYVGAQAGYSTTTGYGNTFNGYQAGYSNDTGVGNTFNGYQAGYNNYGWHNTFVGWCAGYSNTTGGTNVFLGYEAGKANTTASYNTYNGYQAGQNVSSGEYNTFIGYQAGDTIADGSTPLTIANNCTYLGAHLNAKQNNVANEVIIGYNTIGHGSNTVTIGNTSITDNYLTGNLQIGNKLKILEGGLTPSYYTIIQGGDQSADLTYTLPTAYPGASGYVLSSTDAGVMSWVEMSAGSEIWYLNGSAACYDSSVYIGETVNRNGLLTVYGDVGTFTVGTDGISYVRTGSSSDTIFILNSTSGGTNPGYMASWVAYNDTKYLKCVNGTSGLTLFEIGATGQITSAGNAYPTTTGTAGQVLTTDGAGVLSWQNAGAGSCYWSSVAGGIAYNNNAYVYSDGYLALDNAVLISACAHTGFGNGTLQYSTSGRFAGRNGLLLFHDSYWQDLVEWNDNYLVNLIDVYTLGSPSADSVLVVHSNRTVDYTLLSSIGGSKWTTDSYGIHYSTANVGIGTDSDYIYKFTVSSSGYAIQGLSSTGVGVMGSSSSGAGIVGNSSSSFGVQGVSQTNYGVYGSSASNYGGVFAGLGVDISSGGLFMGGTNVINASRVADFASLKIGGTERISAAGIFTPSNGASGTWTTTDGKTITALNGIITGIV